MEYESAKTIRKELDISKSTLVRWSNEGKIGCIRLLGGKRLYRKKDITDVLLNGKTSGLTETDLSEYERIAYARVSSSHQKEDLDRQVTFLKSRFPNHKIVTDIASGLNFKRPGLKTILEQTVSGNVRELVVTDKDRICRFGYDLFEWILKKHNVRIVVQFQTIPSEKTAGQTENDMAQDILAICNYFVAKNNGLRAQRNRKARKERKEEKGNGGNEADIRCN
jgi:predicted site-specific integrase-resolvase